MKVSDAELERLAQVARNADEEAGRAYTWENAEPDERENWRNIVLAVLGALPEAPE